MKIKNITLYNFANYSSASIDLNDEVTYLVGPNGSGKSTVGINAVWFILQGIAEKSSNGNIPLLGERFRFIGDMASTAFGELTLYDEKLKSDIKVMRKLTKTGTELSFAGPAGMELNQQWLNDLFNVFLIAPKRFIELSSKDQATTLGIDTSEWDKKISEYKSTQTDLNRDLKAFGELVEPEKMDPVDFSELSKQKDDIIQFNKDQDELQDAIDKKKDHISEQERLVETTKQEIIRLQQHLQYLETGIEGERIILAGLPKPEDIKPLDEIQEKIEKSTADNKKAAIYTKYLEDKKNKEGKEKEIADNKKLITEQQDLRLEYIKKFKFPFQKLSVDDDGSLLLGDKPLKPPYFSTGELIRYIPTLLTSQNPELKYIFLQDFNLLDEKTQKQVEEDLVSKGFQLVIEYVGTKEIQDKACIVLKDSTVIASFDQTVNATIIEKA